MIGQPIYKTREVLEIVGSVASAFAQVTLPPLGGVYPLGQPRPGNPVEGNVRHTQLRPTSFNLHFIVLMPSSAAGGQTLKIKMGKK